MNEAQVNRTQEDEAQVDGAQEDEAVADDTRDDDTQAGGDGRRWAGHGEAAAAQAERVPA